MGMDLEATSPGSLLDSVLGAVQNSSLECILRGVLERNIGPAWQSLLRHPPSPWPPEFMVRILDQHWNAVFASVLPKNVKILVSVIGKTLVVSGDSSVWTTDSVKLLAKNFRELLLLFGIDISHDLNKIAGLL